MRPIDVPAIPNAPGGDGSDIGAVERNALTAPPTFASDDHADFQISTLGSFTITTFANPTATISLNGTLPPGVNFTNNGDGTATLSGTPATKVGGVFPLVLTANNGINPTATQNFTLTVQVPLAFTNSPSASFLVGAANSYTITTIGVPTPTVSRTSGNLPFGLIYTDNGNGTATISGNPVAGSGGVYPLTIVASNDISAETVQNFVLTINEAPAFTSPDRANFLVNTPGEFFVRTRGYPYPINLSIIEGTLPNNITFNPANGLFAGTPDAAAIGSYPLTIQATNGISPDAFQALILNVCQAADITVNSAAESGSGSLRQAIIDACPGSTIIIAPSVTGQINLTSPLAIEKDLNIVGPGANLLTLSGGANRVITIGNNTVNLSGLTLANGNTSFFGGAMINNGNLTLDRIVVTNSNATSDGGGIYSSPTSSLTLIGSTVSGNTGGNGGGIYSDGVLNLVNSTISGNNAFASGGGLYLSGASNLTNVTITGNRADRDNNGNGLGGGIFNNNPSANNPVTLRNNIVAGNFLRPVGSNLVFNDLDGTFFLNAFYNLIGDPATSGGISHNNNGNIVGNNGSGPISVSLVLNTTLALNGGTTPNHQLQPNSPAIDKGSAATIPLTTDQRGLMRPYDDPMIANSAGGNGSDIGAVEVQSLLPLLSVADISIAEGNTGTVQAVFTVKLSAPSASPITIQYQTQDNTAHAPGDYTALPLTTLNIPALSAAATFNVTINSNTIREPNKTFFINFSNASGANLPDTQAVVTIINDEPTGSDFDGDGQADVAVWTPTTHNWRIIQSSTGATRIQYDWGNGALGDQLVPGDYDGDRLTDFAVWRASEGNWYIINSTTGAPALRNWGHIGDVPVPGDYDGDGKTDIAVWRPSEGNWYIINSRANTVTVQTWGVNTDRVVPADYDGDGLTDIAVWRPAGGVWFIKGSAGTNIIKHWGNPTDVPVPANYDGDNRADIAVWRPAEGNWYIISSRMNTVILRNLGLSGDVQVPAAYLPQ